MRRSKYDRAVFVPGRRPPSDRKLRSRRENRNVASLEKTRARCWRQRCCLRSIPYRLVTFDLSPTRQSLLRQEAKAKCSQRRVSINHDVARVIGTGAGTPRIIKVTGLIVSKTK